MDKIFFFEIVTKRYAEIKGQMWLNMYKWFPLFNIENHELKMVVNS